MRYAYCYDCKTLSRLEDRKGNDPNLDPLLQDWIDRHLHGKHPDDARGMLFAGDPSMATGEATADGNYAEAPTAFEDSEVVSIREELARAQLEVYDYRDELKEDALKCFERHRRPEWPGKPCIDYRIEAKELGRKDTPKAFKRHLCDFCPYNETVITEKRRRAGYYK